MAQAMKRDEVIGFLSSHRQELEERFGVRSLALFGFMARDEAGPESDVDVLVEFRETPGLAEYMRLKFTGTRMLYPTHLDRAR